MEANISSTISAYISGNVSGNISAPDDNRTVAELAQQYPIYTVGVWISQYYIPFMFAFGLVGNTLSFAVMTMPANRTNSCCNFMAALSISDSCMMYVALHLWVLTPGITRPITLPECQYLSYCFNLFTIIGVYLIVFMTIERFIAVRFPLQSVHLCTTRRARITIAVICVVTALYGIQFIFTIDVLNGALCSGVGRKTDYAKVFSWINAMVGSFIPFCSILILNCCIIRTLYRRKQKQRNLRKTSSNESSDVQLAVMLILVSFAFLFLTLPLCVRYILANILDHENNPYHNAVYTFLYHFTQKLSCTNNAVNFYLYCIGGAKFRADLVKLCSRSKPPEDSSSNNRSHKNDDNISTTTQTIRF